MLKRETSEEREPREKIGGEDVGSPPPRDSEETTTTVFWGDDEGPVVMVWDGMTQEEQVIAQTVISGEKDWVIWRTKPTRGPNPPRSNGLPCGVWYEARGSNVSRVKVPKKIRKRVRRRLHKKERLVSPK